jgi:hypothetical protein
MLSNQDIVQAHAKRAELKLTLKNKANELHALRQHVAELEEIYAAADRTTEVFNGVALEVFENHVRPVSYAIPRSAEVFEHVRHPGSFRVMTKVRGGAERVLDQECSSVEEALLLAKTFVTSK